MTTQSGGRILAVLFTGVLIGALDIAIVGPALPAIGAEFEIGGRALSWVVSVFILANLIGAPLLAKLSDRYGSRRIYMTSIATFAIGSVVVASAQSYEILLVGRAIQAFGAGGVFPVASAVIAETFPLERRGRALGAIGAVFGVAFLLGPLLGGLLLPLGWQWLFLINVPIAALVILAAWRILPGGARGARGAFDWAGAVLLATALAGFAWGFSEIDSADWLASALSLSVWPFVAVGVCAGTVFWFVEKRAEDPILHPQLFRSTQLRLIGGIAVAAGLVEAGMVFLPAMAVAGLGVSPATASFMLLPLVMTLIVGAPAAGYLIDRIGAKPVIQIGLACTTLGLVGYGTSPQNALSFYLTGAVVGLGLSSLLGAPLRYVALQEAGEERRGVSQGLLTLFLSSGQLTGAALVGGVVGPSVDEVAGFRNAMLVLAVGSALAFAMSHRLRARRQSPVDA